MADELREEVERHARVLTDLVNEVGKALVGQEPMVNRLLVGLLTAEEIELEGLEVQCAEQVLESGGHASSRSGARGRG